MKLRFFDKYATAIKWFSVAVSIKLVLFVLFAVNFIQNWPADWITNFIFILSGDTTGYYVPIESFVNGNGYYSFCRMPGLLPIYGPLYFLFGEVWGKTLVIVLQFLTSALSVYVLARTAELVFNNKRIFYISFFLYAISSFVSIWDHYGYSDSFATSFMIFTFYFFVRYAQERNLKHLFLSGAFMTWSLFFRPINGLVYGCFAFILFILLIKDFKLLIRAGFLFVLPCIVSIGIWASYNYHMHKRFILLQGSFSDCYVAALTNDHLAIRDLIIAWGGDFQEWSIGTEAEWFFSKKMNYKAKNFFTPSTYTSGYNLDSLINLKVAYDSIRSKVPPPDSVKQALVNKIVRSAGAYKKSYQSEHAFRFYILNRVKFLQRFMFPTRLDNLPFPKVSDMKLYQKLTKAGYLVLLNLVSLLGLIGIFVSFSRKNLYVIIPLSIVFIVACLLGFVEQRYLLPAYPFFCIYSAVTLEWIFNKFRPKTA
jgi:hypothetical protein